MEDPWLGRWLPLISQRAAGMPVLELGCGSGDDTAVLAAQGLAVIGIDLKENDLALAKARVPGAVFLHQDLRLPFPVGPQSVGVVLASLSLHYLPWDETERVVGRIHDALVSDGVLICRFNSTDDANHGATGYPAIDDNYYLVDGHPKRFFDGAAVQRLFRNGWSTLAAEERVTHKYGKPKHVWEVVVAKAN